MYTWGHNASGQVRRRPKHRPGRGSPHTPYLRTGCVLSEPLQAERTLVLVPTSCCCHLHNRLEQMSGGVMWEKERANKTGRVLFACGPRRIHKGQSEIRTFDLGRRPRSGRAIMPQKSLLDVLMSAKDFVEPSQPDCDIYIFLSVMIVRAHHSRAKVRGACDSSAERHLMRRGVERCRRLVRNTTSKRHLHHASPKLRGHRRTTSCLREGCVSPCWLGSLRLSEINHKSAGDRHSTLHQQRGATAAGSDDAMKLFAITAHVKTRK